MLVSYFGKVEFLRDALAKLIVRCPMEISYNELRCKEVVNLQNGVRMGKIIDLILDTGGKEVLGLVVPGIRRLFRANEDIFIPWCDITKIGDDVILVSLNVRALTSIRKSKDSGQSVCNNDVCDDYI